MYLREYHAKKILEQHGAVIPPGGLARSGGEASEVMTRLGGQRCAVKAQIAAGGRGLAGGVQLVGGPSEAQRAAAKMIGAPLVTQQTGPDGERVESVYVEAAVDFDKALYVAMVVDQRTALPTLLGSAEGGVDFEQKARENPAIVRDLTLGVDGAVETETLLRFLNDIDVGPLHIGAAEVAARAVLRAFFASEASLIEINPLALPAGGGAIAVDAKIILDGNALFRHPELEPLAVEAGVQGAEMVARENEINFVKMRGDIGLVVNGAGLGLATHDMVIEAGGAPANFMDIRTTASSFQIARGVGLLLEDPEVSVLLVNIHGGGMTVCDTIAEALNFAYARSERKPPIVYRAAGQNAPWALTIMRDRKLPFEPAPSMTAAVKRAVEIAKKGAR